MRARKVSKSRNVVKKEKGFFSDKRKVGLIFVGLFLIVLMVGSMLMSSREDDGKEYEYNGYYFIQLEGYWKMVAEDDISLFFLNDPKSLENITVEQVNLMVDKVYLGFKPGEEGFGSQGIQRLGSILSSAVPSVLPACFAEEGCPDLPIVSCGGEDKVIWLKHGEEDKIYNQDNCVILQFKDKEMKIIDLFIYKLLGVM